MCLGTCRALAALVETVSFIAMVVQICPATNLPRHCEGIHARGNPYLHFYGLSAVWGMVDSSLPNILHTPLPNFVWRGGWWIRFAFLIPSAGMRNICSHQCLHWWQQVSTGHLHLDGFESHHPHSKTKTPAIKAGVLFWWGMVDSNHRRHSQQIYSLSPLATREIPHIKLLSEWSR